MTQQTHSHEYELFHQILGDQDYFRTAQCDWSGGVNVIIINVERGLAGLMWMTKSSAVIQLIQLHNLNVFMLPETQEDRVYGSKGT